MSAVASTATLRVASQSQLRDLVWTGELVPSCEHGDLEPNGKGAMVCVKCKAPAVPRSTRRLVP
jgi:hypothetical protein